MKVHDVIQGSPEWDALRAKHRTGSEASVMMGASSHVTRSQLLHMKATGTEREFSDFVRKMILDKGHEVEALARPIAEKIIGAELYPATISDDDEYMLVSLDGITMMDDIIWEHKQLNADKVAAIKDGRCPDCDIWQVKQGLLVSGAEKCLYMVSDGTEENCHYVWVTLEDGDAAKLLASWRQFDADLAAYVPEAPKAEVIGRAPDELPALHIEVTGMVTASNLDAFKSNAIAVIQGINRDLSTDTDFANAEKTVKWLGGVEDKLNAAKEHALAQTQSIDALFKAIDSIGAEARTTRLELEKLVKARKDGIRIEILQAAQQALFDHMASLNKRLGGRVTMPSYTADFASAMKGKKTVASLKDACDTLLAQAKIDTSAAADKIEINLNSLRELAKDHAFLFNDAQQLVMKANEDLVLLINARISEHEAKEAARIEAEVQRKLAAEREAAAAAVRQAEAMAKKAEEDMNAGQTAITESKREEVKAVVTADIARAADTLAQVTQSKPVSNRPSDAQLRKAISVQFDVPESMADAWLREYGFVSAA